MNGEVGKDGTRIKESWRGLKKVEKEQMDRYGLGDCIQHIEGDKRLMTCKLFRLTYNLQRLELHNVNNAALQCFCRVNIHKNGNVVILCFTRYLIGSSSDA